MQDSLNLGDSKHRGFIMRVRNLALLIPLLTLLLLTACGGGSSSSSSAPSFNNANLSGMFFTANLDQSGGIISEFGDTTFDGKGNGTFTGTYSNLSGANQAESDSGTYSVNSNGLFALTGTSGSVTNCGLSADTHTAVCASVSAKTFQSFGVLVKAGSSGYSNTSLSGTYYSASLDQTEGFTAEFGSVAFDGKGNGTFTGTMGNSAGANQTDNDSGTYAVNPNGSFTLTGTSGSVTNCGLSADTNTAVCSTVNNVAYQNISVMVKAGSAVYSNSSLTGTYSMVEGDTKGGFNSQISNVTFNGQGSFTATGTLNNTTAANQSSSSSGSYSVNANGAFTVTPAGGNVMQCGISADTNTLVCATVSSTADQNIIAMVRIL